MRSYSINNIRLKDEIALVTGGGRGIGRAIAQTLASLEATVIVVARSMDELKETVQTIERNGGNAVARTLDVRDEEAVNRVINEVYKQLGPITILINNAGDPGPIGPVWDVDSTKWWYCLEVNLLGSFLCTKAVLPYMLAQRRGRIINVASGAGLQALAYDSAYVTSKTALIRFTENVALETTSRGVSAFAIDPGTVRTKMTEEVLKSPEMQKWMPWLGNIFDEEHDVPPERAAHLIVYLASGQADILSGQFISVHDDIEKFIENGEEMTSEGFNLLRVAKYCA